MWGGYHSIGILVDVDIFPGGCFLGQYGGTALHINLIKVPGGIFMYGLSVLMKFLFFG